VSSVGIGTSTDILRVVLANGKDQRIPFLGPPAMYTFRITSWHNRFYSIRFISA